MDRGKTGGWETGWQKCYAGWRKICPNEPEFAPIEPQSATNDNQAVCAGWRFDNSYACLPELFYARVNPTPVREPRMAVFNHALAASLGLDADALDSDAGAALLAGNGLPEGAEPIAQAYAGHQFGYFTMLGDGRAILLGEQLTPQGERFDVQLKGAGQTPYSRRGDGRAALGPMLREYIISEALHALGIPSTRSLAVAATGEPVFRETALPGAVLTRVAASHIRVGTFQYASACGVSGALETLTRYTLQRHYPERAEADNPALALLQAVAERQASLVAQWQCVGFIHGVMNTDNMALSGETIDYGPCAFMDAYHPATVFSSIDRQGRYAYGNQPPIAQWNLARLAEALLPVLEPDSDKAVMLAEGVINAFPARYEACRLAGMRAKLGLFTEEAEDAALVESLLAWMEQAKADFTNTFRALSSENLQDEAFFPDAALADWRSRWQMRLTRQPQNREEVRAWMRTHNPAVIPRNHRVEEALEAAAAQADFSVMHRLLAVLTRPYDDLPSSSPYREPMPQGLPYVTYCGT